MSITIRVCTTAAELQEFSSLIEELAANALEPNVFYESWMLIPALRYLKRDGVKVVLVFRMGNAGQKDLIGVFPIQRKRGYRRLPFSYHGMWRYQHCFLSTPLLRKDNAGEALRALLSWLDRKDLASLGFAFDFCSGEGDFERTLTKILEEGSRVRDRIDENSRPMVQAKLSAESYLTGSLGVKQFKKYRKRAEALAKEGPVDIKLLDNAGEVDEWIRNLLMLEASTWKGEAGTALAQDAGERLFFEEMVWAAFKRGQLMMHLLSVGGRTAAIECSLVSGVGAFAFKIAYCPEFARYSPGMILIMEKVRYVLEHPVLQWFDSCAGASNPILDKMMSERRTVRSTMVSLKSPVSKLALGLGRSLKMFRDEVSSSPFRLVVFPWQVVRRTTEASP